MGSLMDYLELPEEINVDELIPLIAIRAVQIQQ